MIFIGRESERRAIGRELSRDEQSTILVFGRRRVGKSELIKQVLRETQAESIFYECKQTSEADNIQSLSALVSEQFSLPPLAFRGFGELLDFVYGKAQGRRMVLVLDEYPYLRQAVRGLDSILQAVIDRHRDNSSVALILCGSFIDVMRGLLERENPLFGRIDLTVNLKPMDYYDSSLFYPSRSSEDKVRLYSVFGGIPYYNRLIREGLSVRDTIIELIAEPGARLENEVSMYLASEISKATNANEVFGALAQGYSSYKDLLSQSHVSSGPAMVDALDKLIRMELVQKQTPINDANNRKKTSYRVIDPMSLFYYRYIFRYSSQRLVLDPDTFYDRYISDDFEHNYVPHLFEEVCRQFLVRQNKSGQVKEPFDLIGRYWYDDPKTRTNGEFDVVTKGPSGYSFYEAKFRSAPVTQSMIEDEISQVETTGLRCHTYGFISRSGFDASPAENLELIHIDELYERG